jgi:hypothetical protein
MSIEAMKQALEVLEDFVDDPRVQKEIDEASIVLRQAIAEAEKQEPVAWRRPFEGDVSDLCQWLYADEYEPKDENSNWQALYTHPQPKREPMTNERIETILNDPKSYYDTMIDFARAIEAAHGIKE